MAETTAPRPPLVLVVDDEAVLRNLLQFALPRQGFAVLTAAGGEEAVALYRQRPHDIALVLMDVNMPGADGPATLTTLRQLDPQVRCCFMTGHAGAYSDEDLRRRGADWVLAKPFELTELSRTLWRLLSSPRKVA